MVSESCAEESTIDSGHAPSAMSNASSRQTTAQSCDSLKSGGKERRKESVRRGSSVKPMQKRTQWANVEDDEDGCIGDALTWSRWGSLDKSQSQELDRGSAKSSREEKPRATKCEMAERELMCMIRCPVDGDQSGHPTLVRHSVPGVGVRRMQTPSGNACESKEYAWGSARRDRQTYRRVKGRSHRCDRDQPISGAKGGALSVGLHDYACPILCLCDADMRCTCIDGPTLLTRNVWAQVHSAL